MFVRIGQFKALPDKTEELRRVYESEAIPAIRSAAGNVSAVLLQQHQSSECFLRSQSGRPSRMPRPMTTAAKPQKMVDKIRFSFAEPPTLTTYDAFGVA